MLGNYGRQLLIYQVLKIKKQMNNPESQKIPQSGSLTKYCLRKLLSIKANQKLTCLLVVLTNKQRNVSWCSKPEAIAIKAFSMT